MTAISMGCLRWRGRPQRQRPDVPQSDPLAPHLLTGLPVKPTVGLRLHRVFRSDRLSAWFFASVPTGGDPGSSGRFDLPHPDGTCYVADSAVGAVLETFQHLEGGLLPDAELRRRARLEVVAPSSSPPAVNLAAARARGAGVTLELFATPDRALTQRWAVQLRRAGHRALWHAQRHDPTGRLRTATLFDQAGTHAPYGDDTGWAGTQHELHTDAALRAALGRYDVTVTRSDPSVPVIRLDESGLL